MNDKELKLEEIEVSHTLGGAGGNHFEQIKLGKGPDFYYDQQIKRELKRMHVSGCRCNERLKAKTEGSKRLVQTNA